MKQNRILIFVLAALVLATAIVVVVVNNTTQKSYDVNIPEGTVQNYLEAVYAGDNVKASRYISSSSFCTVEDLDQMGVQAKPRILVDSSSISGNTAQVKLNVEFDNGGPMGNLVNESHTLRLVRFGTGWQLTGIPWPLYDCGVIKK